MRLACFFILCCIAVRSALPDDANSTLTVDGVTYSNVTFGAATPSSVSVRHSTGVASVLLEKLPPELQKRFDYDPQKAAAYRQEETKRLESFRQQQELSRQQEHQRGEKLESAIRQQEELERQRQEQQGREQERQQREREKAVLLSIIVRQALPEGALVDQGSFDPRMLYIAGLTGVYDDTAYVIVVERSGDFEYTTTLGAYKKVPRYQYLGRPNDIGPQPTGNRYWWQGRPIQFH